MCSLQMDLLNKLNINVKEVLFFHKLEVHELDEDGVQFIVVDNKNFAEISDEKIVSTYNFPFPLTKIEMISVFYSYEPKFKYYIILFCRFIIVLKKVTQLSFVERINDVKNFSILDYYDCGKPQVVIDILGREQPLVTDFSKESVIFENEPRVLHGLNLTITSQMQSLNVRLRETEMQLEEKNRMISELVSKLSCPLKNGTNLPTNRELIASQNSTIYCEYFSVGEPWVRSYLGKWIIGFPISNIQEKPISKFNVFVVNNSIYTEKTLLFVSKSKALEDCEFQISHSILGFKSGVLIVVIQEPLFKDSTITFSCNASFCCHTESNINQLYLGKVIITMEDILSNKLAPFRTSKSFRDIITYLSVSLKSELHLNYKDDKELFFNGLLEAYGFISVTDRYMINVTENSVFKGVLISVEVEMQLHRYCIKFYYRKSSQLNLLLQSFEKLEPQHFLAARQPDLSTIHACIRQEMNAVQSIISGNIQTSTPSCTNILLQKDNDSLQSLAYLNYFESQTFENIYNSDGVNKHFT